jgi:hypothetical protein
MSAQASRYDATYQPGPTLLAAQRRAERIRQQDIVLKCEIATLAKVMQLEYDMARRVVLASRGLLQL